MHTANAMKPDGQRRENIQRGKRAGGEPATSRHRSPFIAAGAIIILGFLIYGNCLNGTFLWDDQFLIKDNVDIKNWSSLSKVFTTDIGSGGGSKFYFYRPLQMLTYMADYSLWKLDVRGCLLMRSREGGVLPMENPTRDYPFMSSRGQGAPHDREAPVWGYPSKESRGQGAPHDREAPVWGYHLTNIVLHILVALCILWLVTILFGDRLLAFLTALFFVVHPVHTEAVSYISGRADVLAGLFMLLSLIGYIKNLRSRSLGCSLLAPLGYLLALLSKESSIILPVVLLLYHYTFRVKIKMKDFTPIMVIGLVYIAARLTLLRALVPAAAHPATAFERIPGFFVAITAYVRLLLFPFHLHMEYGNRTFDLLDARAITGIAIACIALVYAARNRQRHGLLSFSVFWFFSALIPVTNIYPINAYMAEHWLYVPSIGFFLILARGAGYMYGTRALKAVAVALVLGLVMFYSTATVRQNGYWREPLAFYERTLRFAPDIPKMHYNLGNVLKDMGKAREAIVSYKRAIELNPYYAQAHTNLGLAYKSIGRKEDAVVSYQKAIEIDPAMAQAYNNLGIVYHDMGKVAEAVAAYQKAIEIDPRYAQAYNNLGTAYHDLGKEDEAAGAYKKSIEIDPRDAYAYNNLGIVYYDKGKKQEAIDAYRKAIDLDADLKYACYTYTNLGVVYDDLGKSDEAIVMFKKAIEINPRHAEAYGNLSVAYFHTGRFTLAIEYYDKAKALGFADSNLAKALTPYRER